MPQKLNQVLAIERNVKSKTCSELTKLHHAAQKDQLFNGFSKHYEPKDAESEQYPPESMLVQKHSSSILKSARKLLTDLFDVTATKDAANQKANANLEVDGQVLAENVPATTLLFLEKQLHDFHTFVAKLPVLDSTAEWHHDDVTSLHKTNPVRTTKTKKVQKAIVLYPATDKHPAQTQLISEDEIVGNWVTIKQSGAMKSSEKDALLERVEKLQKATKYARESANAQEAEEQKLGDKVFSFLLGD